MASRRYLSAPTTSLAATLLPEVAGAGGYALTADDTPDVIVSLRGAHDDATPNANAMMVSNLVALFLLTGKETLLARAHAIPRAFSTISGQER